MVNDNDLTSVLSEHLITWLTHLECGQSITSLSSGATSLYLGEMIYATVYLMPVTLLSLSGVNEERSCIKFGHDCHVMFRHVYSTKI